MDFLREGKDLNSRAEITNRCKRTVLLESYPPCYVNQMQEVVSSTPAGPTLRVLK